LAKQQGNSHQQTDSNCQMKPAPQASDIYYQFRSVDIQSSIIIDDEKRKQESCVYHHPIALVDRKE
jgi:hypothetical protein